MADEKMNHPTDYVDYQEGNMLVDVFITELEDIPLIKENIKLLSLGQIIKEEFISCGVTYTILIESATQLYLLGRYVGCDRKRLHNFDF